MFSCEFCQISKNIFSYRTLPVAASDTILTTFIRIVTKLDPYVSIERKKMYQFLNDKKIFVIHVTKLWIFLQKYPSTTSKNGLIDNHYLVLVLNNCLKTKSRLITLNWTVEWSSLIRLIIHWILEAKFGDDPLMRKSQDTLFLEWTIWTILTMPKPNSCHLPFSIPLVYPLVSYGWRRDGIDSLKGG